jgi:2-methylcitrate dehydratase PrpD
MTTKSIAERLALWVHSSSLRDFPDEALLQAKRCIVDVTGVALAGAVHDTVRKVRELTCSASAAGAATLWGTREPARSAEAAALCNAVAAHVLDYDDTCYDGIVHGSAAVWPAVLACGQATGASGSALLAAFIAGVECEYALGRALSDDVYFKGWWTSGVLGAIGAAAGASKVLGLDAAATRNAISLAACQATGLRAMIGTDAKPFALGRAAQTGVQAARYALAGLDAPRDAFESERGFVKVFADGRFGEERFALGTRYSLVDPGIAFKLFPACSATQAATEAVLALVFEHGLTPEAIVSVECEVTPLVAISLMYDRPRTRTEAQFSLPYAVGCALRYHSFGVKQMNAPTYDDPAMLEVMQKVCMIRNDALEAAEDERRRNPEGARVTIRLREGRVLQSYNGAATGMPNKPMPDASLDRKFMVCASTVLEKADAEKLLAQLRSLEQCAGAPFPLTPTVSALQQGEGD